MIVGSLSSEDLKAEFEINEVRLKELDTFNVYMDSLRLPYRQAVVYFVHRKRLQFLKTRSED